MNLETAILLGFLVGIFFSYWHTHHEMMRAEKMLKKFEEFLFKLPGGPYLRRK